MVARVEFKVSAEDPQSVVPLFSNFVAISRAGTEVQFDFIALDINELALKIAAQGAGQQELPEIKGKMVSRVVVPLHVFMQLEQHIQSMFSTVKQELAFREVSSHEQHSAIS
jgi:hypothetical protein